MINGQFIFSIDNINSLKKTINNFFSENNLMSISDFKLLAKTSRKYAVPLLEYLDKEKITTRVGDKRKLSIDK